MEKRLLISIRLVNNLNCFKTEIPPIKRDFLFGNMFFVILIYPVIDCVLEYSVDSVVSNTSKILKRKQITTLQTSSFTASKLFPIRQRYEELA